MLVLCRKERETIIIGGRVEVTVLELQGNRVKLGIKAPADILIQRQEIVDRNRSNYSDVPDRSEPRSVQCRLVEAGGGI